METTPDTKLTSTGSTPETPDANPTGETKADERRRILREFLDKKALTIHVDEPAPQEKIQDNAPSLIVQANADGSLKPAPPPPETGQVNFRAFPDGTFCKFTEIPQKPGFMALCLNTAAPGDADVLHQVAIVKSRAVADMLCDGVNCMMQLRIANLKIQQEMAAKQQQRADGAQEEADKQTALDTMANESPASLDTPEKPSESVS